MKKLTAWLGLFAGLLVVTGNVWAINPDALTIRVTPNGTRSVAITDTEYNFGTQDLGTSTMSLTAVDVENDGSLPNTYSLNLNLAGGTGTNWTAAGTPAHNVFAFHALFNSAAPSALADFLNGASDVVLVAPTAATDVAGNDGVYEGDQSGVSVSPVAASDNRNLWFRLDMPTTSDYTVEQQFNVVVTAN